MKQRNSMFRTSRAHASRIGFCLLFLLAVCLISFALAERSRASGNTPANTPQFPIISSENGRQAGVLPMPKNTTGDVLWDQYNNPATEPPININSQSLEPAMAAFGYGTGRTNWNRKNADQVLPDQVFQILGFVEGPTPTSTPTLTPTATATPTTTPMPSATPRTTPTPRAAPTPQPRPTPPPRP